MQVLLLKLTKRSKSVRRNERIRQKLFALRLGDNLVNQQKVTPSLINSYLRLEVFLFVTANFVLPLIV